VFTVKKRHNFTQRFDLQGHASSASEMTYIVSSGALNSTHSLTRQYANIHIQGRVCVQCVVT